MRQTICLLEPCNRRLSSDYKQRAVKTLEQFEEYVPALYAADWGRDTIVLPYVFDFPRLGR